MVSKKYVIMILHILIIFSLIGINIAGNSLNASAQSPTGATIHLPTIRNGNGSSSTTNEVEIDLAQEFQSTANWDLLVQKLQVQNVQIQQDSPDQIRLALLNNGTVDHWLKIGCYGTGCTQTTQEPEANSGDTGAEEPIDHWVRIVQ